MRWLLLVVVAVSSARANPVCPRAVDPREMWAHEAFPGCSAPPFNIRMPIESTARPCQITETFPNKTVRTATLSYDAKGHLISIGPSVSRFAQATCTYKGDLLDTCTDESGQVEKYEYDAKHRLVKVSRGTDWRKFTWGPDGVTKFDSHNRVIDHWERTYVYKDHRLVEERESSSTVAYHYDDQGRFVRSDGSANVTPDNVTYDSAGHPIAFGFSGSKLTWDAQGRVVAESGDVRTTWAYVCK
ncbi:MAG: hypothetical protein QM831_46575 [Kofleriaceae bacterium]